MDLLFAIKLFDAAFAWIDDQQRACLEDIGRRRASMYSSHDAYFFLRRVLQREHQKYFFHHLQSRTPSDKPSAAKSLGRFQCLQMTPFQDARSIGAEVCSPLHDLKQ